MKKQRNSHNVTSKKTEREIKKLLLKKKIKSNPNKTYIIEIDERLHMKKYIMFFNNFNSRIYMHRANKFKIFYFEL